MPRKRLLPVSCLPASLWEVESKTLVLPPAVVAAYTGMIDRLGLRGLSARRSSHDPPVGGLTAEKTNQHFAQAFDGSVARVQLAMLDPKDEVPAASNAFIRCLAGNSLALTDAPCGAGAAAAAFLGSIAELRKQGVLPREPLDVTLIGAEFSALARDYARQVIEAINPDLEQQAIFVSAEFREWDVTSDLHTTYLVDRIVIASADCSAHLLVVANFSGFLQREKKWKEAMPQIAEILRHSSGRNNVAVWIEPDMNIAVKPGGLFTWVAQLFGRLRRFVKPQAEGESILPVGKSSCRFRLPLAPGEIADVRLAVMAVDLERSA